MLKTTWGVLDPPVGNTRLNVVRLVASLLQTNTHIINQELINLNMLGIILVSCNCWGNLCDVRGMKNTWGCASCQLRVSNTVMVCVGFVFQDMYFKYIWNNFLHIQVEICIAMILAMPPTQNDLEINREEDQEPVRENILITHVSGSLYMLKLMHSHSHAHLYALLIGVLSFLVCAVFPPLSCFRSVDWCRESWRPGAPMKKSSE